MILLVTRAMLTCTRSTNDSLMVGDAVEGGRDEGIQVRRRLALQFFARLAPRHTLFRWPESAALLAIQDHLYDDLELGQDGEESYKQLFLKELLRRLEGEVEARQTEDEVSMSRR